MSAQPPPAHGVRLQWSDLPARIRAVIEERLGGAVVSAVSQRSGFSPGMAARLQTAAGRRAFVKAVAPELNPDSPDIYRREARVAASLPASAPVPRLLWTHDEGVGGWVVLAFEDVEGWNPAQPWRPAELDRVIDALVALAASLTPSPIAVGSASEVFERQVCGWQDLRQTLPAGLDDWSRRHLDSLAALEAQAPAAVAGETLLHLDIRADNLLLTDKRVLLVDWPAAATGAAWVDLVGFAPSVTMQGGPPPEELLARHPAARAADPAAIDAAVAALAGYFTQRALQPPPPGLPTLRPFQAAQGVVAREWLARRLGLD
jgi:aminoglycoside phosphotransferase (APT) family kinase protein